MTSIDTHQRSDELAVVAAPRRLVELEAVHNFRDLGGYAIAGGRRIGWGRLFRADGLYRLTDADIEIIDAIGVRTVIDLRSSPELDQHGCFPVDRLPVDFHHLSILDATWQRGDLPPVADTEQGAIEFLTWAYADMLATGADRFARAIHVLAAAESMPAVFHCAAGKDRTGVLAALILGGLGVDHEVIVADYALTAAAMQRMRTWVPIHRPEVAQQFGETPAFMLAASPEAMRNTLDRLVADHGSIVRYLESIGVDASVLERLAAVLVD